MVSPLRRALHTFYALTCLLLGLWLTTAHGTQTAPATPHADLDISLDPHNGRLAGRAHWQLAAGDAARWLLNRRLEIDSVTVNGHAAVLRPSRPSPGQGGDAHAREWLRYELHGTQATTAGNGAHERIDMTITWRGQLADLPAGLSHGDTLAYRAPSASPQGSFLPAGSAWYPLPDGPQGVPLHTWRVALALPEGQHGLVPGRPSDEYRANGRQHARFDFPYPGEAADLVAGPYIVRERHYTSVDGRDIILRSYFHPELHPEPGPSGGEAASPGEAELASAYLEAAAAHLRFHEAQLAPYPYDSFAIVSSPTPTGFGMPAFTYLGVQVLRLPFIRDTSLGHEILHNWWGNGVYPDYRGGNWSEGLTTWQDDHRRAEAADPARGRAMRLGWLRELSAIPPGDDPPLASFTARHHGVSQAVGYGKAAMIFAMLEARLGRDAFDAALRRFWAEQRFRVAGWGELQAAFEAEHGASLARFFDQWLRRSGLPQPQLADVARGTAGGIVVTLSQATPAFELDVPVRIETASGTGVEHSLRLDATRASFELAVPGDATRVVLDPDSRLLRRMAPGEAPPILRELQLDQRTRLVVTDDRYRDAANALAERLLDTPPRHRAPATPPSDAAPLLVVGPPDGIADWLQRHSQPPPPTDLDGRGQLRTWTIRLARGQPVALVSADDPAAIQAALRPLPHYGQQSWLVMDGGRVVERGVWPANAPTRAIPPVP
ncbi:MAG: M1 family metallopeptidase [Rhodocyclaceae bacterium]